MVVQKASSRELYHLKKERENWKERTENTVTATLDSNHQTQEQKSTALFVPPRLKHP